MKRLIVYIMLYATMSNALCVASNKLFNKCNGVDPEVVSFVTRVVAPLAHLYDLSEDELTAVRAVGDWSRRVDDNCKKMICSDALLSAIGKVSRDEVSDFVYWSCTVTSP